VKLIAHLPSSAEVKECVELCFRSPSTPSWRRACLKHRDNLAFYTLKDSYENVLWGWWAGCGLDSCGSV